jgi:hypothetical protein
MQHVEAGFLRLRLNHLSVAELSSSLQGDSEMLLKRWLSGFREPVGNEAQTGEHHMHRNSAHQSGPPDTMT